MRRIPHVLLIALVALALSSATALAKKTGRPSYVPPNQSAASQYTEAVPTAGGNTPSSGVGGSGGSGGGSGSGSIPATTLHRLDHSGSAGAAAAALARSLSPTAANAGAPRSTSGTPSARGHASATGTSSTATAAGAPAAQVLKTLGGSDAGGGIGFLLPVILVLSLVVATGLGLLRIRRTA